MTNTDIQNIIKELAIKYDISNNACFRMLIETIGEAYGSVHPIILRDGGAFITYEDNDNNIVFSKIVFSKKKSQQIANQLQINALKYYLKKSKVAVLNSIKNNKKYLYSVYQYSSKTNDYYYLYFDMEHTKIVKHSEAVCKLSSKKKTRIYIDTNSATIVANKVQYREFKKYINLQNIRALTKELSREIYDKIGIKIWIDVKGFDFDKREVYINLPFKTFISIIDYIRYKYRDVFGLKVILIYQEKDLRI